jgi:hypothetical protein
VAFGRTAPLRREIEAALPVRPFVLGFWDGSDMPATVSSAPTFSFRSPRSIAHLLRPPGELGLGRAYVAGLLEVDDIDAALRLADSFEPPPLDPSRRVRNALAQACGLGGRRASRLPSCGWGSFALHAAARHGARVVGITLSEPQAELARRRASESGVADTASSPGETFDAIASIGMVEHVGEERIDLYARRLASLLEPAGRLLNHGLAKLGHDDDDHDPSSDRRVPGRPPCTALARAAGARARRVWRLYLHAARIGFETGYESIYQVRCQR